MSRLGSMIVARFYFFYKRQKFTVLSLNLWNYECFGHFIQLEYSSQNRNVPILLIFFIFSILYVFGCYFQSCRLNVEQKLPN